MRPTSPAAPARAVPVTLVTRTGPVLDDRWIDCDDETCVANGVAAIVALPRLESHWASLKTHEGGLGVRLQSDEAVERLAPFLGKLDLVAIVFPKFRDGRGYSAARLLRERFSFAGELRAVGDVLRDQIGFMARCGIDSFALKDADPQAAIAWAFVDGRAVYQPAADDAQPVWRRREQSRIAE